MSEPTLLDASFCSFNLSSFFYMYYSMSKLTTAGSLTKLFERILLFIPIGACSSCLVACGHVYRFLFEFVYRVQRSPLTGLLMYAQASDRSYIAAWVC